MNAVIKQRKDYKNPSLYEALRDTYEIDEKGTNFPANVYDPNGFRPDDFYDALGRSFWRLHEFHTLFFFRESNYFWLLVSIAFALSRSFYFFKYL